MARQWMAEGVQVHEDGAEEIMVESVQLTEDTSGDPGSPFDAALFPRFVENQPDRAKARRVVAY